MDWRRRARVRYEWHRRGGLDPHAALDAVAIEYGLAARVVRLTDPSDLVPMHWTLDELDQLGFLRWAREQGRIGGPDH